MARLLDLLGSSDPIVQKPIGERNDPKRVAADSETRVFGMLAPGFVRDLDAIEHVENTAEGLVF